MKIQIIILSLLALTSGCSSWSYERDANGKERLLKSDFLWKRQALAISRGTNGTIAIKSEGSQTDGETIGNIVKSAVQGAVQGAK